jgi:hypothetical protein
MREQSSEKRRTNDDLCFRALGLLPLLLFIAQAVHYGRRSNEFSNMLWMCNVGNLLLAFGMLFDWPVAIRVAGIWMIPGLVVWFLYVFLEGVFFTSTLAHIGGLIVGLLSLRRVGVDRGAWLYALAWYFVVQLVSRVVTPDELNVNVSKRIYAGWERSFGAYWKFWLALSLIVAALLWIITFVLNKLWPPGIEARS